MGIRLIVGLGNPGPDYAKTRHNAGAWVVETLAREATAKSLRTEKKFHGLLGNITLADHACHLLIPTTFMNESGRAVRAVQQFFNYSAESILVAHDDLDLPAGTARLKSGGGHGGHNGLRDIIQHLGVNTFHRLRIGIGHPGHRDQVLSYVLKAPSQHDLKYVQSAIATAIAVLPLAIAGHMQRAMTQLHTEEK